MNGNPVRDGYTRLVAGVVFPLQEKLKHHTTVAVRKQLDQSQWWPPEKLEAYRLARLRRLLQRAGRDVPYYQALFARTGFDPSAVQALSALERLPFLTKADIRAGTDALKATTAGTLQRSNTGGSSGEPLIFYLGNERVSHDVAAKWRATRWWNVDIGDPEIVVWGSPIELGAQDRIRAWRDRIFRTELLPAFQMSQAKLDQFVARIRAVRPRMLFGYPSSLAMIARHAEKQKVRLDDLGVRVAFVTSERLYDEQRQLISQAFACRVANGYGGRDAGFLAHECPEGSLHITAEDVVLEIVGNDGRVLSPGESGEIVVTHLASGDFPFIRYRTGDVGVLAAGPCRCGRSLPVLQEVQGRTTDFVVAADGTVMHGLALIYVIRDLQGVRAFKIIQESLERTRVLVVPEQQLTEALADRIRAGFRARLGAAVEVSVERVDEIPPEASGKHRYIVSRVAA